VWHLHTIVCLLSWWRCSVRSSAASRMVSSNVPITTCDARAGLLSTANHAPDCCPPPIKRQSFEHKAAIDTFSGYRPSNRIFRKEKQIEQFEPKPGTG
jgi:hypothetical protein